MDRDDINDTYRTGRTAAPPRRVVRRVSGRAALERVAQVRRILEASPRPESPFDTADGPEAA